jgi:Transcriptional regulators
MAIGALLAAREAGLRVPDDVSIAGFDGIPMAEVVDPPLTTVQQPIYELGRKLADVILTLLEAERRKEAPVLQEIVPCRLVVRGSTAPLRARA